MTNSEKGKRTSNLPRKKEEEGGDVRVLPCNVVQEGKKRTLLTGTVKDQV